MRGVKYFGEEVDESVDHQWPKVLPKENRRVADLQSHHPMSCHQPRSNFTVMAVMFLHAVGSWWHLLEAPGPLQLDLL